MSYVTCTVLHVIALLVILVHFKYTQSQILSCVRLYEHISTLVNLDKPIRTDQPPHDATSSSRLADCFYATAVVKFGREVCCICVTIDDNVVDREDPAFRMCDNFWEPLAEIYIADREASDSDDYIYCLCSRVFIR